ncbi:MAG: hypothetical protein J6578_05030 [Snodgrassella sp.]|uniref:hypothetical protein n=1 Tax=Snodgrassella sp. TaxID=2815304 RepID=UPI0025851D52|nr:hypothetical protein [Snodgrassella sp.]MCO6508142.1 hypothetical protein [Snodgrassella sp.]
MTGKTNIKINMNYYYTYNNEALVGAIFKSILNMVIHLDIARGCLVLPFLLDERTVNCLIKNSDNQLTLSQLIKNNPRVFVSFNKRYLSLLPVYINFITIFQDINEIDIINNNIVNKRLWNFGNADLGLRFNKIQSVIPKFLNLIESHQTTFLYKILKIEL